MVGRQVIETTRAFTLQELDAFMKENWDTAQYNGFAIGRPTAASVAEYVCLPATDRFMVIVFSRKGGGLFSKKDKVVLSVCNTPEGALQGVLGSLRTRNVLFGVAKVGLVMSMEEERKGPAEDMLLRYTEYMKSLLSAAGYVK